MAHKKLIRALKKELALHLETRNAYLVSIVGGDSLEDTLREAIHVLQQGDSNA